MDSSSRGRWLDLFLVCAVVPVFLMTGAPVSADLAPGGCVGFEDLTPETIYHVPDTCTDSGVPITTGEFQWTNGTWTSVGSITVQTTNWAGGLGNDLNLNNITLDFNFVRTVTDLRFLFGEYGGNINLTINGDFRNEVDLADLHGELVGGALVEVIESPTALGVVRVHGTIASFSIGGQELWIDDLCDDTGAADCVDFEDLPFPHMYDYGGFFVDSGVLVGLGEFFWYPSGSTTAGTCHVVDSLLAGGSGLEAFVNNVNLEFDFGSGYSHLELLFNDFDGNINLRVNGQVANVVDINDLNQTILGGAFILVQPPTGSTGSLFVMGSINDFAIGGQELWIDNVCIADRALFGDGFEYGNTIAWSSTSP